MQMVEGLRPRFGAVLAAENPPDARLGG